MKKWAFLIIAALFGFEEYQLNKVRPMVAPDKDVLPPIHDLVVPIAGEGSAESLTRQIEAIVRARWTPNHFSASSSLEMKA